MDILSLALGYTRVAIDATALLSSSSQERSQSKQILHTVRSVTSSLPMF